MITLGTLGKLEFSSMSWSRLHEWCGSIFFISWTCCQFINTHWKLISNFTPESFYLKKGTAAVVFQASFLQLSKTLAFCIRHVKGVWNHSGLSQASDIKMVRKKKLKDFFGNSLQKSNMAMETHQFLTGDTSSFMAVFPLSCYFSGVYIQQKAIYLLQKETRFWGMNCSFFLQGWTPTF